jgi:1,4-dihydroxy-2-naphthoyl-CoA hydrolase
MVFEKKYTVKMGDTDAAGRIYFASPPDLCHRVWEDYLETKGVNLGAALKGPFHFPVVAMEFQFKGSLSLGDSVVIGLKEITYGQTSMSVHYEIKKGATSAVLGKITHVCLDSKSGQPSPIPAKLKENLA